MLVQLLSTGASVAAAYPLIITWGFNGAAAATSLQNMLCAVGMAGNTCVTHTEPHSQAVGSGVYQR